MTVQTFQQELFEKQQEKARILGRRVLKVERELEQSQSAVSLIVYAYADLPTPVAQMVGWKAYVTDGRRSGEGAGAGNGVEVVCGYDTVSADYRWLRTDDYSEVTV
jgi:hypothetical protein